MPASIFVWPLYLAMDNIIAKKIACGEEGVAQVGQQGQQCDWEDYKLIIVNNNVIEKILRS